MMYLGKALIMMTTRAGHAKKRAAELAASARQYQHPPLYDHDVDNIGLSLEELKQRMPRFVHNRSDG